MIPRYSSPEISKIWSEEHKYVLWIRIELNALKALRYCNIIPEIKIPHVKVFNNEGRQLLYIDFSGVDNEEIIHVYLDEFVNECLEDEKKTTHDVASCVNILEKYLGEECGKYIHYGMTGSDVVDTALALSIKHTNIQISDQLHYLKQSLIKLARENKNVPIMGRTHGMQAEATSLGLIFALYAAEFSRHLDRLNEVNKRICVGKMSGSVGNYAHISPEVEKTFLKYLNLEQVEVTNQIIQRDRHAELINLYALIGTTVEKLATQIRHYSRTEIGEMAEGHGKEYTGSSSMPHKKNPIGCENICGLARMLRGYMTTAMENNCLWLERDISHSSTERIILPDASQVLFYILSRMDKILSSIYINKEKMRTHVEENIIEWSSQYRMLQLINKGLSRKKAHEMVQHNHDLITMSDEDKARFVTGNKDQLINYYLRHVDVILSRFYAPFV